MFLKDLYCELYITSMCLKHLYCELSGSTISTLLHDRINPKDCQVLSLGDTGFLQFFRVVSRDGLANPDCESTIPHHFLLSQNLGVLEMVFRLDISPDYKDATGNIGVTAHSS